MLCGECDSAEHFFALINLRYLINHYCFFADFFLTYNEEYVIMVQNRTIMRKWRVNVFWGISIKRSPAIMSHWRKRCIYLDDSYGTAIAISIMIVFSCKLKGNWYLFSRSFLFYDGEKILWYFLPNPFQYIIMYLEDHIWKEHMENEKHCYSPDAVCDTCGRTYHCDLCYT